MPPNRRKGRGRRHRHGGVASRGRDDARSGVETDERMDPLWGGGCTYFDGNLTNIFHKFLRQKTPLTWG